MAIPSASAPDPDPRSGGDLVAAIRAVNFSAARRGYDRAEVDRFLAAVAERLESGERVDPDVLRRELEQVGENTKGILTAAEETARKLRASAEEDARHTRAEAGRSAEDIVERAENDARQIVEEAVAERQVLEARIRRLGERRDAIVEDLERLSGDLSSLASAEGEPGTAEAEADTQVVTPPESS
jgi:DivIVA domain-containing protein